MGTQREELEELERLIASAVTWDEEQYTIQDLSCVKRCVVHQELHVHQDVYVSMN